MSIKINSMKIAYFKIVTTLILIVNIISCKAQQIQPLNTKLQDINPNAYLKDQDNELEQYVGNYVATYQNNTITLYISKEIQKFIHSTNKNYYQDVLSVRYTVKNSSGSVLQNTQNMNFEANQKLFSIYSMGTLPSRGSVSLYYGGTNCGIGWGDIYLKKINNTQISWEYRPDSMVFLTGDCPPGTDKTVYLPVTKNLIFTKL